MKYRLIVSLLIIVSIFLFSLSAISQNELKDEIYKNSFRQDIPRSMQDIPFEDGEYYGKHYTPYSLVRLPRKTKSDKEVLVPGYYLVKPFSENSVDYLIFKKLSSAVAVVPVIDKGDLPKEVKKMEVSLIEEGHGTYYIVTIKYKLNHYSVKLEIVD